MTLESIHKKQRELERVIKKINVINSINVLLLCFLFFSFFKRWLYKVIIKVCFWVLHRCRCNMYTLIAQEREEKLGVKF